ncbi:Lin0512 family protein [Rhodobacteraceae bacterium NNCM2]|nr:Lin0512 family protein [Coraliihabitans acroporae]
MSSQRVIIEMGTGNDLYGEDYTKAAIRAVEDAIRHSSLPLFESLDLSHDEMFVQVTIGAQRPDMVDVEAVNAYLPRGSAQTTVVKGGLNVTNDEIGKTIVIATAAVEAFLPNQSANWRRAEGEN